MNDGAEGVGAQAEALARCLGAGLVTPRQVVAWVDDLIRAEEEPDVALLDASLLEKHRHELIGALRRIPSRARSSSVARLVFHHMLEGLRRDDGHAEGIARELYRMALDNDFPHSDAEGEMWRFDDAFELSRRGIFGGREALVTELDAFLQRFAAAP